MDLLKEPYRFFFSTLGDSMRLSMEDVRFRVKFIGELVGFAEDRGFK
jgi:hypothetical protein